ncbi:hypothetical protein PPSIR1_41279 [Plesiocystis pacifica SIR-1]|uniref:Uncharacterized protein n=1 Tax=Plesiocystis pacifica SIR-1 TaxID=391625 RepID=A6GFT3_9BACT|nr:hypothetical protein [Plesiocystis pacifica]EDM75280.1 hypothetical protein PPSIR1_41279 [Plesiocystis pacifica SIR-1]
MSRGHLTLACFALGLGAGLLGPSCVLPNPDHCLHKAVDTNAWCAEQDAERPYCSPCAGDHHGCVAEEPTQSSCPEYSAPAPAEADTDTDTGLEETG